MPAGLCGSKPGLRKSHSRFLASWFCCLAILCAVGRAQQPAAPKAGLGIPAKQAAEPRSESDPKALEKILAQMDTAAANFRTAQADFMWEQYTRVVDEKDDQKGTIYYRRQGKEIQMMADLNDPTRKAVLFRDGKIQVAQPRLDVKTYEAGKNREALESFLVLGFGGSGKDLTKQFDVKYLGEETIDGVKTAKLELRPKADGVRKFFDRILLWIDPALGISRQQQFFEPDSGNYRLAKYSAIQVNQKISDNVFKLPSLR